MAVLPEKEVISPSELSEVEKVLFPLLPLTLMVLLKLESSVSILEGLAVTVRLETPFVSPPSPS